MPISEFPRKRPRGTRLFHNIAIVILATASLAYFSMASDLGATPIQVEFNRGRPGTRQIWVCTPTIFGTINNSNNTSRSM